MRPQRTIFTDNVTHDGSSRTNLEVYKNILSANLWRNASNLIGRKFIMQQDNDPKHTANTTKNLIRQKKHEFQLLKGRLNPPKQTTETSCSKSITKEECDSLVKPMGSRLDAGMIISQASDRIPNIKGTLHPFFYLISFNLPPKWQVRLLRWYPHLTDLAVHTTCLLAKLA